MKKAILPLAVLFILITGCTTGDLRLFGDSLAASNGNTVTYPDQQDTTYLGDIRWTTGVKNGNYFQVIKNTGDKYIKVRITYENNDYSYHNLKPYESTGTIYRGGIYNVATYMSTLSHSKSDVFNESFDD